MSKKSALELKTLETLRYLRNEGLLTGEHALTAQLLRELCIEWEMCSNSTQRAAISREIRSCLALLPHTEASVTDEAQAFLDSLSEDAE